MKPLQRTSLESWALATGIDVAWPESYVIEPTQVNRAALLADKPLQFNCHTNPCIDFGRLEERIPGFVLRPRTIDALAECVRLLRDHHVPYKVRGAGHSSGGQSLIHDGAVIDTRHLCRIVADDPQNELITVEGGALWLDVADHLAPQGRRPLALTDQLRTSVAGTLAVGGFCDTGHIYGFQLATVTALTVVTPDGSVVGLEPTDELFQYTLGGLGQLGTLAQVTVRTMRKPAMLACRLLRWLSVAEFVRDATVIAAYQLYDFMRARIVWREGDGACYVDATVGGFTETVPNHDAALDIIAPSIASDFDHINLLEQLRADALEDWHYATAAMEIVLPLPSALSWWPALNDKIVAAGIHKHFRRGAGTMVLPTSPRLPLAPVPDSPYCMVIALRPRADANTARALLAPLREIAQMALDHGGKIYMMGVETLDAHALELQFGEELSRFVELKRKLDPHHLCNPGPLLPVIAADR